MMHGDPTFDIDQMIQSTMRNLYLPMYLDGSSRDRGTEGKIPLVVKTRETRRTTTPPTNPSEPKRIKRRRRTRRRTRRTHPRVQLVGPK